MYGHGWRVWGRVERRAGRCGIVADHRVCSRRRELFDQLSAQWQTHSLRCHERIAAKIRAQPALLDVARSNLDRWLARSEPGHPPSPAWTEWREILSDPDLSRILALLTDPSEEGHRRRQSSPFAGILSVEETRAIRERAYEQGAVV